MANPFQTDGLVWVHGKGMFLFDGTPIPILTKPIFNFNFHSLYCEPTICKRVLNDKDYELTPEEIAEVLEFIAYEKTKPQIVNGVDADGKFYQDVDITTVRRVVTSRPPESGMWRLDPTTFFEQWVRVYPVDKDGYLLYSSTEDATQFHEIIRTPVPTDYEHQHIQKWKWDRPTEQWIDGELYEDKIKVLHERKIEEFSRKKAIDVSEFLVEYKGNTYHADTKSLETLITAITLGVTTIDWYPKSAIEPVKMNPKDMKDLAVTMFDKQQEHAQKLFAKKAQVRTTLDVDEIVKITW